MAEELNECRVHLWMTALNGQFVTRAQNTSPIRTTTTTSLELAAMSHPSKSLSRYSPGLPMELVYHVVEGLREDRRSLSACSLVCRSWKHLAQRWLFHHLKIRFREDSPSTRGIFTGLLDELLSRSPLLATCIQNVQIDDQRLPQRPLASSGKWAPKLALNELVILNAECDRLCDVV